VAADRTRAICDARAGDAALEVHHLGRLDDHDSVVVLCRDCHRATFSIVDVAT
jgi:hypothetical protein